MAYFFPVIFAIPLLGSYLAREWAWYFTPSLSYVGQGSLERPSNNFFPILMI